MGDKVFMILQIAHVWKGKKHAFIIDDNDYEKIKQYRWCKDPGGYIYGYEPPVKRNGNKTIMLSRLIMNAPKGMEVDHVNGKIFDNRKQNLRICSHRENIKYYLRKKNRREI